MGGLIANIQWISNEIYVKLLSQPKVSCLYDKWCNQNSSQLEMYLLTKIKMYQKISISSEAIST